MGSFEQMLAPNQTKVPLIFVNVKTSFLVPRLFPDGRSNLGQGGSSGLVDCPALCHVVTGGRETLMQSADAVVWNPRWLGSVKLTAQKPASQRWVFNFFYEAPVYMGTNVASSRTRTLNRKIDWAMTFKTDSDFLEPMLAMSPIRHAESAGQAKLPDYSQGRDKILLWLVSNCGPARLRFAKVLQAALPPGSFMIHGGCGEPSPCIGRNESDECHQRLFSRFKFYAAFENSRCDGYITEKFYRGIREKMVPLVLGGLTREDYMAHGVPRSAFVSTDDFSSMSELVSYLTRIDAAAYNELHRWRRTHEFVGVAARRHAWCRLCQELHKPVEAQTSSWPRDQSLTTWWYSSCRDPIPAWR